ncbi:NAD(P)-binding protein [Exidia glandulosa HHB12029]|uniref:NAD(P)-binding protein n=1 Tax=Exidia glandulosa HHB12029 TaxID=1314781 RepID=A0A165ZZD1_EXIGL|nr:NAD(P)-binding protein [Exidia glandulosa HHB12029]
MAESKLNVLMCGTGEYTTGWVGSGASTSDKKVGVVGLTCFDLRRLGKIGELAMVGVNGKKYPQIRTHLQEKIADVYKDLDVSFKSYPDDNTVDAEAYKQAIDDRKAGDAVIIFTPDSTHYPIALYAIEKGLHVLVTKPATQLLEHHQHLIDAARAKGVVCFVEHHKRFDPVYSDARARARTLGEFNFYNSWMSQPKLQLETFKAWAGKDSDIRSARHYYLDCGLELTKRSTSYYLNSHHIDIHTWIMEGRGVPTRVVASAAKGIATSDEFGCVPETEDTITLLVDWESVDSDKHRGTAVYTSSWTAPLKAGIHTAQHWYYMGAKGEIAVDQAHRGYDVVYDDTGKASFNPFYMKYSPSETGHFDGQRGYGYVSIEKFIDAARDVNAGKIKASDFDKHGLPTIANTVLTTAILNAGRISLDQKRPVLIKKNGDKYSLE